MEIEIKKAGIISGLFLSYEYEQTDPSAKNNNKTKSDAPIHDDLRNAFRALIPHFAYMCEEITDKKLIEKAIKSPEKYLESAETSLHPDFLKYSVNEFSLIGKGDSERIKISGSKRLESFKYISFTAPEVFLDTSGHEFINDLNDAVETLKSEVLAYMEGKQAPKAQIEMFAGHEEFEEEEAR